MLGGSEPRQWGAMQIHMFVPPSVYAYVGTEEILSFGHPWCYVQRCIHDSTRMSYASRAPRTATCTATRVLGNGWCSTPNIQSRKSNDFSPAYPASDATKRNGEAEGIASSRASSSLRLQTRHIKAGSAFEQGRKSKAPKGQVGGYEPPSP